MDTNNEFAKEMNENQEMASNWKGRLLIHISVTDTKYPQSQVIDIPDQMKIDLRKKISAGNFDQTF